MHKIVRRAAVMVGALALVGIAVVAPAAPASASTGGEALFFASPNSNQVVVIAGGTRTSVTAFPVTQVLAGHFTSDAGAQAFLYNPGTGPDGLLDVTRDGDALATDLTPYRVEGRFTPFVSDFDLDGHDDIFWYAPGLPADHIWFFQEDGSVISQLANIQATAQPIPVLVDGINDQPARQTILWYGVGDRPDSIWTFTGRTPTSKRVSISGTYRPVVGHFFTRNYGSSRQQVLFYDPAGGRNSLWTFHKGDGNHRSDAITETPGRNYIPFVTRAGMHGNDFLYWYGPGPNPEKQWAISSPTNIQDGGGCCQITGTYRSIRDPHGRSADEEIVFLGEDTTARTLQLAPEHGPILGTITPITGLPKAPRGAVTWFEAPVA